MKEECVSCGKTLNDPQKNYELRGNYCGPCNGEIDRRIKVDNYKNDVLIEKFVKKQVWPPLKIIERQWHHKVSGHKNVRGIYGKTTQTITG